MTTGLLARLLLGWAIGAGAALALLAFVTNVRGRWGAARALLTLLAGGRPRGLDGVVLQEGPLGCGRAALATLYLRLGLFVPAGEAERRVPAAMPLSMLEMTDLLAESGLSASGYEFQSVDQLRATTEARSGSQALLLLDDYGTGSLLVGVLLFPFRLVARLHRRLAGPRRSLRHWTLLEGLDPADVVLLDPFLGRVAWSRRRFARIWTGYALVVAPRGAAAAGEGRHAVG